MPAPGPNSRLARRSGRFSAPHLLMPALFRRQSNIQCFFCQTSVTFPPNIRNFKCPSCSCWNRYDDKGEIVSDEPAMHEEHLNSRSFAKRGM